MKVAVLSGGRSSEHAVSLRSGASVADGLRAAGHEVLSVLIERDGRWSHDGDEVSLMPGAGLLDADAVFPVLHGPYGEDGTVQGLLECLDVPYTGCDVLASALCMDKLTLKRLFAERAIPQVDFVGAGEDGWQDRAAAMGLPLWVKPSRLGSSVGISKVTSTGKKLEEAVEQARRHDPRVIVEASAAGKEVECAVLGNDDIEVSMPGEIDVHADWYDYEAKYSAGGMELIVPARIDEETINRVRELAAQAFRLAGCSGFARCDFFVEPAGRVLVNEINTIPGFTATSAFGKLFEASGIPYSQLCDQIVRLGIERHERSRTFEF